MKILYVTALLPDSILKEVYNKQASSYVFAPQKFHRNIVEGLLENDHQVRVLSFLPSFVDYVNTIEEDGIQYSFIRYINRTGIKHFQIAKEVFHFIRKNSFKPDAIICDTLNTSMCIGALVARLFNKICITAIITDLPKSVSKYDRRLISRLSSYLSDKYINVFDNYVLLTSQMNDVVNMRNRPFIIMEGICESQQKQPITITTNDSPRKRKLLYAGGRPSKDGIDMLIAAFKRIPYPDIELNVYGSIPNVSLGKDPSDERIIYHGKTENSVIAKAEQESCLLINPRPTNEEYTKYSFPSKVMEYMASGTPMVTTKLAGIPQEYYDYVFTFDSCDENCYYETLSKILCLNEDTLKNKGIEAQKFVMTYKNNVVQAARIIELITN